MKLAFLSSLTRKYLLSKDYLHDFSTSGAPPLTPPWGSAPRDPQVPFAPPQQFTPVNSDHRGLNGWNVIVNACYLW